MTRKEWLQQLKVGDSVAVYSMSQRMQVAEITSATRTQITIGKYAKRTRFRRSDGMLCGKKPMGHLFRIEPPTNTE